MSLRPDDRSSRHRDKSRSRSRSNRSRSRSDAGPRRPPSPPDVNQYLADSRPSKDHNASPAAPPYLRSAGSFETATMPAMPGPFDDIMTPPTFRDSMQPGGYPGPKHAATFPVAGGGAPYPTSGSFFPDPNHYDITGLGTADGHDEPLAYGHDPQADSHRRNASLTSYPSSTPATSAPSGYASYADYTVASPTSAPSPNDFYGSSKASAVNSYAPEPARNGSSPHPPGSLRKSSNPYRPEPSRTASLDHGRDRVSSLEAARFYQSAAPTHLTPTVGSGNTVAFGSIPTSRPRSSSNLSPHIDRMTIGGDREPRSGGLPPPSPLLEAYKGTYQSISPMMAPFAFGADGESDISDLEPLSTSRITETSDSKPHVRKENKTSSSKQKSKSSSSHGKEQSDPSPPPKFARHVTLYDAAAEALALSKALSHTHASNIDTATITATLPELTHDQILLLRTEYKRIAKVNGRGINLAKHLKLKLTGPYGKAAHVTALGRWEGEGYWAGFFYQSHASRRELLIESLMGRSNADVRAIVDAFKDKRYADDLRRMVERELRADKFRACVLWALEGKRQEETDVLAAEVAARDVAVLREGLARKEGGESAMLEICVRRSDAHLREVLKAFQREMGLNFAKEVLKRSGNLVGEVLAHILNGVINRPARDVLLLRHAIRDIAEHNKDEELRYELLISRLIRLHWDRAHLEKVKREYRAKTGRALEADIEDATKGDFRGFMVELCNPRS